MPTWPGREWDVAPDHPDVDHDRLRVLFDRAFEQPDDLGLTLACIVIRGGCIVAEQYGPETAHDTTLISWSMAKSITNAVFGLLVGDGLIRLDEPAPVPAWAGDERRHVTVGQLLEMSSGLEFVEDYVDAGVSHVIEMLFGAGIDDHAGYAASFPLVASPGTLWNYASGTSNILARIATDRLGGRREDMERYLDERLFQPIGMTTAIPKFDTTGTFVGSSYVYATARDFARFGWLFRNDGIWAGERLLPEGWVSRSHEAVSAGVPASERHGYGLHWWRWQHSDSTFSAHGYEGQRIVVAPTRDAVVVRLGKSDAALAPAYDAWIDEVLTCLEQAG